MNYKFCNTCTLKIYASLCYGLKVVLLPEQTVQHLRSDVIIEMMVTLKNVVSQHG